MFEFLTCESKFNQPEWTNESFLEECKVLVVGAGGLGCEILKNLVLMNFKQIDVIDMDTIDLSNLNRQFLFREKDIGKPKAEIAAKSLGHILEIKAHFCKIQDKDFDFYSQFHIVICGLDSIQARRWMNSMLFQIYQETNQVIPMIDGGTESLKGHVRVILPGLSSCFDCNLDIFPKAVKYPLCTIANLPRLPEHCIEFAIIEFEKLNSRKPDPDQDSDLDFVYQTALKRALNFNIQGVTLRLTLGVIKNIIPAIASTNALIAAISVLEAFKLVTRTSLNLNNFLMFNGAQSSYSYTFEIEKNPDCLVCGSRIIQLECDPQETLKSFIDQVTLSLKLNEPSVRTATRSLYFFKPKFLEIETRRNLDLKLTELLIDGEILTLVDSLMNIPLTLKICLKNDFKKIRLE